MACDASTHMPAYSGHSSARLPTAAFHGQHGEEGGPGYLVIDGPINADGSAKLHAKGTVQAGKAGLVTQLKGNKYDYNIEAKFTDTSGTGKRDEGAGILGRPCSFRIHQAGRHRRPTRRRSSSSGCCPAGCPTTRPVIPPKKSKAAPESTAAAPRHQFCFCLAASLFSDL